MDSIQFSADDGKEYLYGLLAELIKIAERCGERETAAALREIIDLAKKRLPDGAS